MKNILYILFIVVSFNMVGQTNTTNAIASCCDVGRRCTGSAYCSACTNCSGCKYCAKNGGSCGVCSVGNAKKYTPRKKRKRKKSNRTKKRKRYNTNTIYRKNKTRNVLVNKTYLYVSSSVLNLRKGASSKYKVIAKLPKNTKLIYIKTQGNWIKIKVVSSGLIGYVYYKFVY